MMGKINFKMRELLHSMPRGMNLIIVRYLPFIIVIALLKLFVVFVVTSGNGYDNNYVKFDDYGVQIDDEYERQRVKVDFQTEEKQNLLSRLNDTVLVSSSVNRTPHDTIWLFFNRIPRTGGQTLVSLIKALGEDLDFQHQEHTYRTPWQRLLTDDEQKNLATWFEYNFWPKSYDRYSLWINFSKHKSKYLEAKPAYITMVRDPVEKFISSFRYQRMNSNLTKFEMKRRDIENPGSGRKWYWQTIKDCVLDKTDECNFESGKVDFVSSVPYLCGQREQCLKHDDKWALQMAKFNAEYEYSVVGVFEQFNMTLGVMEHYVPRFFKGAFQRYWSKEFLNRHENRNPKKNKPVSEKVKQIIKSMLSNEYELYEFLLQRLHNQYDSIASLIPLTSPLPSRTSTAKLSALDRLQIELSDLKLK